MEGVRQYFLVTDHKCPPIYKTVTICTCQVQRERHSHSSYIHEALEKTNSWFNVGHTGYTFISEISSTSGGNQDCYATWKSIAPNR